MPRLLAVPNLSVPDLPPDLGLPEGLTLHYAKGDRDHGRSVVALSGAPDPVVAGLLALAERLLPAIDLRVQTGAHPRLGALDVVPFVDLEGGEEGGEGGEEAGAAAERFAEAFTDRWRIPVLRYERSSPEGARLPDLRRAPGEGHPRWGATVVGARGFLIAANLDFPGELLPRAKAAARELRRRRDAGEGDLAGVRALAFGLPSRLDGRGECQLSFNLTRPDDASFDRVAALAEDLMATEADRAELVGVIRPRDLPGATRLSVAPGQVVEASRP